MRVHTLEGNRFRLDGGAMYGNVPKALWSQWSPPDDQNRIQMTSRCLYVDTGESKILCETGIGHWIDEKTRNRYAVETDGYDLIDDLNRIGILEEEIDYVVLSHLHFDHCGGLIKEVKPDGSDFELHFPNAQIVVGKEQLARATSPHLRDRASYISFLAEYLNNSKQVIAVDEASPSFDPALSFIFSNGHTPGQLHILFELHDVNIFYAGDLIPGAPWLHLPVTMGYDRCAETLVDEKSDILSLSLENDWIVVFSHDPAHAAATVMQEESGRWIVKDSFGTVQL